MYTLRLLGGITLLDGEGRELDALLGQSKHVALLAYLALPRPGAWHRRDSILGTFWPEHDQSRARSALRSALYILRGHFPAGTIRSRGDDELSVAPEVIVTDVSAMSDDLASGQFAAALARYKGELLPGIYVAQTTVFEKWLEAERSRVRGIARKAAEQLADQAEKSGDLHGAIDAARRAAELDPDDEAAARRLIALLDRAGDRAQAFAVYERFRNHMSEAFGVRPSAETVALLDAVRTRREVGSSPVTQPPPAVLESAATSVTTANAAIGSQPGSRAKWLWLGASIAIVVSLWLVLRPERNAAATTSSRSLVVLPMIDETGDAKLAYIASGIAEGIARRLEGIGGIRIRSGARSDWNDSTRRDLNAIGREFGSTILLRTALRKVGDSLEVRASVVDASTSEERPVATQRFKTTGIRDAESNLTASIAGAVFRAPIPTLPRSSDRSIDPESYRLTLEGWHQIFLRPPGGAVAQRHIAAALFQKAIDIDPLNARAWSGLSSVWASLVVIDAIPHEEGSVRAIAASNRAIAIDSLQGTALANLAIMRAFEHKNIAVARELLRRAEVAEPSNPEVFLIKSLVFQSAHLYDEAGDARRVASQLDPLSPLFASGGAGRGTCGDRPAAALKAYQSELTMNPSDRLAQEGVTRSLALLGRYDEAIVSWRASALAAGDTPLATALAAARGKDGYWSVRHAKGRERLADLDKRPGYVSPLALARAHFAAGDAERGFNALEKARQAGIPALYRLSCMEAIDEFRDTPRFAEALNRIGALRSH